MCWLRLRRGRLVWACAALLALPVLGAAAAALAGQWGRGLFDNLVELYTLFLIPFVPALLAAPVVADEIEQKTFTFVFARPAPRSALVLGKFAATTAPAALATALSLSFVWLIAMARFPSDYAETLPHFLRVEAAAVLGVAAYAALATALGTLFTRHPFVAVAGYILVIEAGLGSAPIVLNLGAIAWHLRNLAERVQPVNDSFALPVPALVSAAIVLVATPALLAVAIWRVRSAEYRSDR
jgi:ABC-type transport system involved in multi-copper enzyme maturation permease subunit